MLFVPQGDFNIPDANHRRQLCAISETGPRWCSLYMAKVGLLGHVITKYFHAKSCLSLIEQGWSGFQAKDTSKPAVHREPDAAQTLLCPKAEPRARGEKGKCCFPKQIHSGDIVSFQCRV